MKDELASAKIIPGLYFSPVYKTRKSRKIRTASPASSASINRHARWLQAVVPAFGL